MKITTVRELTEMLEGFDGDQPIVVRIQERYILYGCIGGLEEYESEEEEGTTEEQKTVVITIGREGYSPEQALE